jgi:hypothetical protein
LLAAESLSEQLESVFQLAADPVLERCGVAV